MTTKTMTDPVAEAETALAVAREAEQEAVDALQRLDAQIIGGDITVTAQARADAEHAVTHAKLIAQGATQALQNARDTARLDRLRDNNRAQIEEDTKNPDEITALANDVIKASARLIAAIEHRNGRLKTNADALKAEGVPQIDQTGKPRTRNGHTYVPYRKPTPEHGNLGWEATFTGSTYLYVDDRVIKPIGGGDLFDGILRLAITEARAKRGVLSPLTSTSSSRINDIGEYIRSHG